MKIKKTKFKDLIIFKSRNFYDKRGFFRELAIEKLIKKKISLYCCVKIKKKCSKRFAYAKKK